MTEEKKSHTLSSALLGFLFAIGVDIIRAIVLAFVLNMLVLPAFGLASISVLTAYAIDMCFTFLNTPIQATLRNFIKDVVYGPVSDPKDMVAHLKKSDLRKTMTIVVGLLLQALFLAAVTYFLV